MSTERSRARASIGPNDQVGRLYPERVVARAEHDRIDDPVERHERRSPLGQAAEEPPQPIILPAVALVEHDHTVVISVSEEVLEALGQEHERRWRRCPDRT
jgi:hypothetical protein